MKVRLNRIDMKVDEAEIPAATAPGVLIFGPRVFSFVGYVTVVDDPCSAIYAECFAMLLPALEADR